MTCLHRLLTLTPSRLLTNHPTCVASGASGVSAALLVVVVWRLPNTAFLMESHALNHALMETETENNKNAIKKHAQLIAKGVGVSTLLALPLVAVEFSLACSQLPKKPFMVARLARRRVAPWRTIPAAQKCARTIAWVIGTTGVSALVQPTPGVVKEAPRPVVSTSQWSTRRADAHAAQ